MSEGFNIDELFVNPQSETEGVWVEFYGGSKLKVASMDSKPYKAKLAKLARQHKLKLDEDNPEYFDLIQAITVQALAEHVLLDWEGIHLEGKQNIPYTVELGVKVLAGSSKVRSFVEEMAGDYKTFKEATKTAVKKPSTGS